MLLKTPSRLNICTVKRDATVTSTVTQVRSRDQNEGGGSHGPPEGRALQATSSQHRGAKMGAC